MRPAQHVILALLVLLVVAVGALWLLQRRLIYLPAGAPGPVERVLPGAQEVSIPTADGLELAAWFLPAGATGVVVLPGNAGNRADRAPLARALADAGLSVLLVDYRGYGGNPGRPTEQGLIADGDAAAGWLAARAGIDHLVYLGESLGAAVAVEVAVRRPPAALVLRSPFASLPEVARAHYGPVPSWLLLDRFDAVGRIAAVDAPLLVLAVPGDEIVPFAHSRRLHRAATEPKRFVEISAGGHNDPDLLDGPRLIGAVTSFLRRHGALPPVP